MADTVAETVGESAASGPLERPSGVALYGLGLVTIVSFFNYMDRMVLSVVLEPIKQELHLSDTVLGLISGYAFAAIYATVGLPLARVADRGSRVRMLSLCLGVWSLMTALTGLARNGVELFAARMGVGIGEAGCVPAAHSLIGDYFPPEKRAFGISVFQAGGLAGLSAGLAATGYLADHFGWRVALMCAGLPGLPLALLIWFTMGEPVRRRMGAAPPSAEPAWQAVKALLMRPALRHLVLALSVASFASYGLSQWIAAYFMRVHHLSLTEIGTWLALATGVGSVTGTLLGGYIAGRLMRRDTRWELWLPMLTYGIGAPLNAVVFLLPSAPAAIATKLLATLIVAAGAGVALSAVQSFAEPHRRATAISLVLFLSALVGLGAGPLVVGMISDMLNPSFGQQSLRYGLLVATVAMAWASLHMALAARSARIDRV